MEYIGYIKYHSEDIIDGTFDAMQAVEALSGFDTVIRYFLVQEDPLFQKVDFSLPVKIQEGSWGIFTPENIENLIILSGITTVTTCTLKSYLTETAKKAANDGLLKTGMVKDIKSVFKNSYKVATNIIRLASHLGGMKLKLENTKVLPGNNQVIIINSLGERLILPVEFIDIYKECPEWLFSQLASVVNERQSLEIGFIDDNNKKKSTKITCKEKAYFYREKDSDKEIVLPELKHGDYVKLEGLITRCNETENSIGFRYNDTVLTCKPSQGKIIDYKNNIISNAQDHIYPPVEIVGQVEREDVNGNLKRKRPRIIFDDIYTLETNENYTPDLFE